VAHGPRGALAAGALAAGALAACHGAPESPRLAAAEQAAVVLSVPALAFPATELGKESVASVRISPAGGTTGSLDTVTAWALDCADFEVTGAVPAEISRTCGGVRTTPGPAMDFPEEALAGEPRAAAGCSLPLIRTADFAVTFRPAGIAAGPRSCLLTFTGSFGSLAVPLSGPAVAPALGMQVTPAQVKFGDVYRSATGTQSVAIVNFGTDTLKDLTAVATGAGFTVSAPSVPASIAPGASAAIDVRCAPGAVGPLAGGLKVAADGISVPEIALECSGTDLPLAADSPLIVTRQGQPGEAIVEISNVHASRELRIVKWAVAGADLALVAAPTGPVRPGAQLQGRVRYGASRAHALEAVGDVLVYEASAPLVPTAIPVRAESQATRVSLVPSRVDFGPVCLGQQRAQGVSVTATQAGGFVVGQVSAPAPFSIAPAAGGVLPLPVAGHAAGAVALQARFEPVELGQIERSGVITTDAPRAPTVRIGLVGLGLPAGVSATPERLDFGALDPGPISAGQPVLLTNCTAAALGVTTAQIEGRDVAAFGIASPASPVTTLAPGDSMELLIVVAPGAPGVKEGTLVIGHAAGTTEVALTAETIDPSAGSARRGSYYDCSASGGPGGAAPLLAALGGLWARRGRRRRT
jgi:MYXO-CTERM domain-containing protein